MADKKQMLVVGVAVVGAVGFLVGVVDDTGDTPETGPTAGAAASTPADTTAPPDPEPDATTTRPTPPTSTTDEPATVVELPDVRGQILSSAHSRIVEAGFESVDVVPVDDHAFAVDYSNWRVVGQDPTPAPVSTDTDIRLDVVKTEEAESDSCWDGDCRKPLWRRNN